MAIFTWRLVPVKVTKSLYLIQHQAMKACEEMDVKPHTFLTLAVNGGVWPATHLSPQYPVSRAVRPHSHCEFSANVKNHLILPGTEPWSLVIQSVA